MAQNPTPDDLRRLEGLTFIFLEEGAGAARDGLPLTANPYRPQVAQHLLWVEGWKSVQE